MLLVSGQLSQAPGGGAGHRRHGFPAAFRPPAFASWASCSRQGTSALLTVGLPGSAWTLAGFPRSAHPSHGRIGRPLYPEAQRCSHGRSDPSGRRSPPLPGARPYHPGVHSISRSCLLRGVIKGSLAFARPAFPLACWPRMGQGPLGLAPRASHPGRQDLHGARRSGGRASSTRPELYARHHRTGPPSASSLTMCDLVSHDRPGHDPLPDRRPPGLLGRARPRRPPVRPPQAQAARRARATPTSRATAPRPPTAPPAPRPSSASGSAASPRLGGNKAKCAVGRSILIIIWHLLADPEARFTDLGPDWHNRKTDRDRKIRAHLRQLHALGLDVTITPAASQPNPPPTRPAAQKKSATRHIMRHHARVRLLILTAHHSAVGPAFESRSGRRSTDNSTHSQTDDGFAFRLRAALRASLRDGFASLDTAPHSQRFSAGEEDGGRAGSDLFE